MTGDPSVDPEPRPDRLRRVRVLCVASAVLFAGLALARWATFHNRTFDLALYARMAWGLSAADLWEPILSAHVFGLHVSPVLAPLGWLGRLADTAVVLLLAQAAAVGLATWPLARMGERRLGAGGGVVAALAWVLYPNLAHVATYEFHPGTLAVLPLAWGVDALDRRDGRGLMLAALGALACREDLAILTGGLGLLSMTVSDPALRRWGLAIVALSGTWLGVFVLALQPALGPDVGSMQLHFGQWGDTAATVVLAWLSHPTEVLEHLAAQDRLLYLPKILLPLCLLPLLRPRLLLVAAPMLIVNAMSDFPTTTDLSSHYLTPTVPLLVAAGVEGAERLRARRPGWGGRALVAGAVLGQVAAGLSPLSPAFDPGAFVPDARTAGARAVCAAIPTGASVQAPDALLAHLADRPRPQRAPPPERVTEFVVLDAIHRERFAGREDLLRATEEPLVRRWLARPDHRLVAASGGYLLLQRGRHPRAGLGAAHLDGSGPVEGAPLTACLRLRGARRVGAERVRLDLSVARACPNDLAVRVGVGVAPARVELLFDGHLSPASLASGDRAHSYHLVPGLGEADRIHVGALRSSGARPEPADPISVPVEL